MRSLVYSGCRLHSSKFHPIWCSGSSGTRTSPSLLRSAHRVPPSGSRRRSDRCRPSQAEPSRQHILLEVLLKTLQESQAMAQQVRRSATVFFTSGRRRHCRFRLLRRLSRRRSPRRFLPPPSRYTSRCRQPSFASLVLLLDQAKPSRRANIFSLKSSSKPFKNPRQWRSKCGDRPPSSSPPVAVAIVDSASSAIAVHPEVLAAAEPLHEPPSST
uniref:Uncharacterized protein n=1 Tax=Oryza nivara TaxID=4536 RepID=A0A0E0HZB0_ORYNI